MRVSRWKVFSAVMYGWFITLFLLGLIAVITALVAFLLVRGGGAKIVFRLGKGMLYVMVATLLFSELIIVLVTKAKKVDKNDHLQVLFRDVCVRSGRWVNPRLYRMPMDTPNACAFGIPFVGLSAVAVTDGLTKHLTDEEVKAVMAHEIGHIVAADVAIQSMISIMLGLVSKIGNLLVKGKSGTLTLPMKANFITIVLGGLFYLLSNVLLPILQSGISEEREFGADALGAHYMDNPKLLMSALSRLHELAGVREEYSFLDSLFATHPNLKQRLAALKGLSS